MSGQTNNPNKIKKLCKTQIAEPLGWNKTLWLRIEFGSIVPFTHKDSVIGVYCCHDRLEENGSVFSLMRNHGMVKEYSMADLFDLIHFDRSKVNTFNDLYNLVYDHVYDLILDAYGPNGWFCKYNGIGIYNIPEKTTKINTNGGKIFSTKIAEPQTKSPQYLTHDVTPVSITVSFKHVPK